MRLTCMVKVRFVVSLLIILFGGSFNLTGQTNNKNISMEKATLGAGCFWCIEAIFQNLEGVESVISGYTGGKIKNPTYKEVCSGLTGHAEVAQVTYDPKVISFDELLEVFWQTHDPTTLDRQGNDVGSQYRSAIYYHNPEQQKVAERSKQKWNQAGVYPNRIVTEISPLEEFYVAEDYHQDYFSQNGSQPYCSYVIKPKLDKFKKTFKDKLKKTETDSQ